MLQCQCQLPNCLLVLYTTLEEEAVFLERMSPKLFFACVSREIHPKNQQMESRNSSKNEPTCDAKYNFSPLRWKLVFGVSAKQESSRKAGMAADLCVFIKSYQ